MIDARIATNMLLMLQPKIAEAKAVLEAEAELQQIVAAVEVVVPTTMVPVGAPGKSAKQFLGEMQQDQQGG